MKFRLGIDASNIRAGGGLTHLCDMLSAARPRGSGFERVVIWGGRASLERIPEREWLEKAPVAILDRSLPGRFFWQQFVLPMRLLEHRCDALFSPGGSLPFHTPVPAVTMSQNLLPFEAEEAARFGVPSLMWLKMKLLKAVQSRSFRRADGLIFLTRYARARVAAALGGRLQQQAVIAHGIESRFFAEARDELPPSAFSASRPFRFLYVSIVDVYKHQWQVARAIATLRKQGMPVTVEFVGPARPKALERLRRVMDEEDREARFIRYAGATPFHILHQVYRRGDAFVFASSCENLPNILLEAMAAQLPIACSGKGPMPEILGEAGIYFDPENADDIASALTTLYRDPDLRRRLGSAAFAAARSYSWARCADETFSFIARVINLSVRRTDG
ncbi:MAG: glycosyltransferase family 4 protein [Betaproteobacteria bacterium]|nr:glycosyltransferase family 4 protein [Betaproteobacteria bacterium]